MKGKSDDPFDYKLRSKEEVFYQLFLNPPDFIVRFEKWVPNDFVRYEASSNRNMYNRVVLKVEMLAMCLLPMQLERLMFLLGPRYKNNMELKLVISDTDDYDANVGSGLDMLKQLYLEALRAPLELVNKTPYEVEHLTKMFGGYERYMKIVEKMQDKTSEDWKIYKEKYYSIISNPNLSASEKSPYWKELLEKKNLKLNSILFNNKDLRENKNSEDMDDEINDDDNTNLGLNYRRKEKLVLKDRETAYKELISNQTLTKEAYEMFYKK